MRAAILRAHAVVRDHPRHVVLAALVVGLLVATAGELVFVFAAAGVAVSAGRPRLAVVAVAALVAGALAADARLRALDAGELRAAIGRTIETRAIVLEPVRERPIGPAVARVRLLDGLGAGEQAVLRLQAWAYAGDRAKPAGAGAPPPGGPATGGASPAVGTPGGSGPGVRGAAPGGSGQGAAGEAPGGSGQGAAGAAPGGSGQGAAGAAPGGSGQGAAGAAPGGSGQGAAGAAPGGSGQGAAGAAPGGSGQGAAGAAPGGSGQGAAGAAPGGSGQGAAGAAPVIATPRGSGPGGTPLAPAGGWPEVGDIVSVKGRIVPLGAFDAYQRRRNAHAAIQATRVAATGTRRGGVAGALDGVRRRAEAGLASGLAAPEAALLRGMVLGEDERLTEEVRDDFQRSGLAHILAVSGQNVMLLVVLVLGVCVLTGVPLRARLVLAAAVIAVYVPLAGGGPSIQRAGVMGIAGLVAALAGRPARRWYALLLAAAATLALNPRTAGEPGWQLSFVAVAALLLGAAPLRGVLARRMPGPAADAAAITLAATVGTAPLMAIHFEQVSLAALPANLLAAPAIAPVMWLGVLAAAAAQLAEPLAAPFSALTAPLLVYLQKTAHITAAAPLSVVEVHAPPAVITVAWAAIVGATVLGVRGWRRARAELALAGARSAVGDRAMSSGVGGWRRGRRLAAATVAVAVALLVATGGIPGRGARAAAPAADELVVSFLDIGQGDATLLQLGGASVLVDTGPPDGPIVKRLDESGVKRLDALVLTHAEADHEGAAPAVISRYRPRLVIDGGTGWNTAVQRMLPAAVAAARGRRLAPVAGQAIAIGGLRFEVLWPPARRPGERLDGNPNDRAVVARLEAGRFSMLLSADAESTVTAALALEPVDVLKVAHHGSADPGLPALLKRLRPRIAAIEVGRGNRYGHPTASTVAALKQAVPTVLRTDRDGTVRLHALGSRLWVQR